MTPRTIACAWVMVTSIAASIAGCSSNDGDARAGESGPYVPHGNGVVMAEVDACSAIAKALANASSKLGCTMTIDTCPNYLRKLVPSHDCRDWDRGSIDGAVSYVGAYASCADFTGKPFAPAYMSSQSQCK